MEKVKELRYFDSSFYDEEIETPSLEVWWYDEKYECWELEQLYFEIDDEYIEQDIDNVFEMMLNPSDVGHMGVEISEKEFNKMLGGN